jgi:Gram-negative bacterial TonB protein C-terminal
MMKKLLLVLVIVVISSVTAQTGATQDQQPTQHPDLRLEHADVPMYPQLARTARIFGTVEVQVTVKNGKVVNADVKLGPPVLARATVENIQTWRFYRLVNATFTTKFIYQLETKEPLDPQNPKVELQLPLLAKITAVPVQLDTKTDAPSTPTTR